MITLDEFQEMPPGEVIRVVTTKYHSERSIFPHPLTFIVVKGENRDHPDWSVYYGPADQTNGYILRNGDKLTMPYNIQSILPCEQEVMDLYNF